MSGIDVDFEQETTLASSTDTDIITIAVSDSLEIEFISEYNDDFELSEAEIAGSNVLNIFTISRTKTATIEPDDEYNSTATAVLSYTRPRVLVPSRDLRIIGLSRPFVFSSRTLGLPFIFYSRLDSLPVILHKLTTLGLDRNISEEITMDNENDTDATDNEKLATSTNAKTIVAMDVETSKETTLGTVITYTLV